MQNLDNDQLLARLNAIAKAVGAAGKTGMSAEKERAVLVKECLKRGIIGYPSKKKYRQT